MERPYALSLAIMPNEKTRAIVSVRIYRMPETEGHTKLPERKRRSPAVLRARFVVFFSREILSPVIRVSSALFCLCLHLKIFGHGVIFEFSIPYYKKPTGFV